MNLKIYLVTSSFKSVSPSESYEPKNPDMFLFTEKLYFLHWTVQNWRQPVSCMNLFQTQMQIISEFSTVKAIIDSRILWDFLLYFLKACPKHKETVP